jgi:8-oxo-dGTP pyrophosphatase MutT (NUDIX family)
VSRWKVLNTKELFKAGLFRVRVDECQLPDGRVMPRYYTFEFPDWVNVIPVTAEKQLVLLRQYRHSAGDVFLEIPGGSTHPKHDAEPLDAGKRELLEETGYASKEWIACGAHFPNPAMQNNRLHTFLALNCEKIAEPSLDPFEDLTVELVPVRKIVSLLEDGAFNHSLIAASVALALKQLRTRGMI